MSSTVHADDAIAQAGLADAENHGLPPYDQTPAKGSMDVRKASLVAHEVSSATDDGEYPDKPTEEELRTLRRVSGRIKWSMWTIAFVELCERFSYYGSSVLYTNFVNNPLPDGSNTGAPDSTAGKAGALGKGTQAAQAISLFNQFFAYLMPLLG